VGEQGKGCMRGRLNKLGKTFIDTEQFGWAVQFRYYYDQIGGAKRSTPVKS
jgi:hypothetical protein